VFNDFAGVCRKLMGSVLPGNVRMSIALNPKTYTEVQNFVYSRKRIGLIVLDSRGARFFIVDQNGKKCIPTDHKIYQIHRYNI
jgi:hypothetical protein